jgi:hypothetical protein
MYGGKNSNNFNNGKNWRRPRNINNNNRNRRRRYHNYRKQNNKNGRQEKKATKIIINNNKNTERYRGKLVRRKIFGNKVEESYGLPGLKVRLQRPDFYEYDKNIASLGKKDYVENYNYLVQGINNKENLKVDDVELRYKDNIDLGKIKEVEKANFDRYTCLITQLFLPQWLRCVFCMLAPFIMEKTLVVKEEDKKLIDEVLKEGNYLKLDGLKLNGYLDDVVAMKDKLVQYLVSKIQFELDEKQVSQLNDLMEIKNIFTANQKLGSLWKELPTVLKHLKIKEFNDENEDKRMMMIKPRYWRNYSPVLENYTPRELLLLGMLAQNGHLLFYGNIGKKKKYIDLDIVVLMIRLYYEIKELEKLQLLVPIKTKYGILYHTLF